MLHYTINKTICDVTDVSQDLMCCAYIESWLLLQSYKKVSVKRLVLFAATLCPLSLPNN
jgi:hypothetical protein